MVCSNFHHVSCCGFTFFGILPPPHITLKLIDTDESGPRSRMHTVPGICLQITWFYCGITIPRQERTTALLLRRIEKRIRDLDAVRPAKF